MSAHGWKKQGVNVCKKHNVTLIGDRKVCPWCPQPDSYLKKKVVIEVRGGVADVTQCPKDVEVEIIDHDEQEESRD